MATNDFIHNKIDNKITGVSKISQHNNSEPVTNERDKEIPEERCISPKEKHKIIGSLKFI